MKNLEGKTYEEILEPILTQARNTWTGGEGLKREQRVKEVIERVTTEYGKFLNLDKLTMLRTIEERRDYNTVNYYQDANFPKLDTNDVLVFQNQKEFMERFPSKQFICPACKQISTDPYICNSNHIDKKGKVCDWKAYGLFHTMGKGIKILFKDKFLECPTPQEIFRPIELNKNIEA
jgi:hypothetical protein